MEFFIYDSYADYKQSENFNTDAMCFVKDVAVWFRNGHPNDCVNHTDHCEHDHMHDHFDHCDHFEHFDHDCHHHHHCQWPYPVHVMTVNGVKYWAKDGRLLRDDTGALVPVYRDSDPSGLEASLKEYVLNLLKDYVKKLDLASYYTKSEIDSLLANKQPLLSESDFNSLTINDWIYRPFGNGGDVFKTIRECVCATDDDVYYTVTFRAGVGCSGSHTIQVKKGTSVNPNDYNNIISVLEGYENPTWDRATTIINSDLVFTRSATKGTVPPKIYSVTYNLQNCHRSQDLVIAEEGKSFSVVIVPDSGYSISSHSVTMQGGGNISYTNGTIYTSYVTGNITITVSAEAIPEDPTDNAVGYAWCQSATVSDIKNCNVSFTVDSLPTDCVSFEQTGNSFVGSSVHLNPIGSVNMFLIALPRNVAYGSKVGVYDSEQFINWENHLVSMNQSLVINNKTYDVYYVYADDYQFLASCGNSNVNLKFQ